MLVLSRRRGESIIINQDIEIRVEGILRGKVRLSIKAPKEVAVHRKEVFDRINAPTIQTVPAPIPASE